jgi:hypothetical protein
MRLGLVVDEQVNFQPSSTQLRSSCPMFFQASRRPFKVGGRIERVFPMLLFFQNHVIFKRKRGWLCAFFVHHNPNLNQLLAEREDKGLNTHNCLLLFD